MIVIATLLLKLQVVEDLVWPHSEKHCFRTSFDSQHVKGSQTLVKSAWEHFHHIFSSLWETLIRKFRKLQNVKNVVRPLFKKHRSRTPFDSQNGKGSKTLVKSAWEKFHHIFSSLWKTLIWKISPLVIC